MKPRQPKGSPGLLFCPASVLVKKNEACAPLQLTHHECRLILLAIGARLDRMLALRAQGAISGHELDRRIEMWRSLIIKLEECLGEPIYTRAARR